MANVIPQVQSEVPQELVLGADASPEDLVAAGEQLYFGAGACSACHGTGARAPHLLTDEGGTGTIGVRCAQRVPGIECKEYLYASLVDPSAYIVAGYADIMPPADRTLSRAQVWALVAFLQSHGGEVTVTAADAGAGGERPAAGAGATPPPAAAGPATASLDPLELLRAHQCLACHQLGGEGVPMGPAFDGIGRRLDAAALRTAILDPAADVAAGYEAFAGVMPANYGSVLTAAQLEVLVTYLAGLR
jgi:mono/diheme cytochrome c family protein